MASGRQDYWNILLLGKSVLANNQTAWLERSAITILGGNDDEVMDYLVPVDYRLHMLGGILSCNLPGINYGNIVVDTVDKWGFWFDQIIHFPFGEERALIIESESEMNVYVQNWDTVSMKVEVTLVGFLEYKKG